MLFEAFGEILVELGVESFRDTLRPRRRANPILSGIGFVLLGALIGAASAWAVPRPLFPPSPWPGVSIVAGPIISGLAMQGYGSWAAGRGKEPSYLATFWGGALFAFALSFTRRWLVAGF